MSINFWITNVFKVWRIEYPHRFLLEDDINFKWMDKNE
jgi:hypothetical protein